MRPIADPRMLAEMQAFGPEIERVEFCRARLASCIKSPDLNPPYYRELSLDIWHGNDELPTAAHLARIPVSAPWTDLENGQEFYILVAYSGVGRGDSWWINYDHVRFFTAGRSRADQACPTLAASVVNFREDLS